MRHDDANHLPHHLPHNFTDHQPNNEWDNVDNPNNVSDNYYSYNNDHHNGHHVWDNNGHNIYFCDHLSNILAHHVYDADDESIDNRNNDASLQPVPVFPHDDRSKSRLCPRSWHSI